MVVALGQLILGNMALGIGLSALVLVAVPLFEKREARRHFYRALRKLYVCVDIKAYNIEVQKLSENSLIGKLSEPERMMLDAIALFYSGDRIEAKVKFSGIQCSRDLEVWKKWYLFMISKNEMDFHLESSDGLISDQMIKSIPYHFRDIAKQRRMVLKLFLKSPIEASEIESVRDKVTYNLFVAELTQMLYEIATDERTKTYYHRSVINLSKGLIV